MPEFKNMQVHPANPANKEEATEKIRKKDKNTYDIIIIGGGVSGLMLAKLLDNTNLRVLLLEKKRSINIEPKSFGTFTATAKEHKIESYIEKYFDTWAFYGPTTKATQTQKKIMCLIGYNKWAKDLKFKHVKVKTGTSLKGAKRVSKGITLHDQKREYTGKLIVDSTGYTQIISKLLGLPMRKQTGISFEVELNNCNLPMSNEASFILNFKTSNSGGWLYTLSKSRAQFGWADFYPESESSVIGLKKRTKWALKYLPPHASWFKESKITYSYGRFGPTGGVKHYVFDNILLIGDAGGCGTPATLEGFREALDSAKMAYQTIKKVKNYSKKELQYFLYLFHKKFGKYYRNHSIVRYVYLHWARNEDIDQWISNFKKLKKKDFFRLIKGELTASLITKTLNWKLVLNLVLNMINNNLPQFLQFRNIITPSKREELCEKG